MAKKMGAGKKMGAKKPAMAGKSAKLGFMNDGGKKEGTVSYAKACGKAAKKK